MIDYYLWNEQTDVVHHLQPDIEGAFPEVELWFEIKQGMQGFIERGAAVFEWGTFAWLGCPRNRDIEEYLEMLTS